MVLHHYHDVHLMDLHAFELRTLVRARRVTPSEVVEACLARIDERDAPLRAFLFVARESARAEAAAQTAAIARGEPVGPLAGIPVAVKDMEDARGMPTTSGLRTSSTEPAEQDSCQVGRLRRAGAIVVGKTNTPADGYIGITKNLLGPPARNPWGLDHSPGGSSGGSAAAVAARMVPWATSSDGGGSIRIPATLTGCFGLKPTRGLIPRPTAKGGVQNWMRQTVEGPTTRCALDAAMYMDVTAGYDARDPDSILHFGGSPAYEAAVLATLACPAAHVPLRIGFAEELISGLTPEPESFELTRECMARMRQLISEVHGGGAEVVTFHRGEIDLPMFGRDWTTAVGAFRLARFSREGLTTPEKAAQIDKGITENWPMIRSEFTIDNQGEVFAKIADNNDKLASVFERCDVLVTPSVCWEKYPAGGPVEGDHAYTMMPLNYSGHPSAIIRAGVNEAGMPCGVQLIGERGTDGWLLALSALYEKKYKCFETWPSWPFVANGGAISRL